MTTLAQQYAEVLLLRIKVARLQLKLLKKKGRKHGPTPKSA